MDDLILIVGDRAISGWKEIRVTRGIERCPSDFNIALTDLYPGEAASLVIQPGDPCQVKIGNDLVVTGYIDRFAPSIDAHNHSIRVQGRGKCQDLVDASAEWPNNQILGSSVLEIARKLAKPYGIDVEALTDVGGPIPQFNFSKGETGWELIERICRYRALLPYEQPNGNLALSQAGKVEAANGFEEGVNVQRATASWSIDQRFSEYVAYLTGVDMFGDVGQGGDELFRAYDKTVKRFRRKFIVAEASDNVQSLAQMRAEWECSRRYGRSSVVQLTTDTWRDKAGNLYTPNTLVPLTLPSLKVLEKKWLIGEATYKRDAQGTSCDLIIMPPEAFYPQPIMLQPLWADIPGKAP